MARIRSDYVFGTLSTSGGISATATSFDSAALARLPVVAAPDVAAVTLHDSIAGVYEIVHVTAHAAGATSATILRGQEGSTARVWAAGAAWLHGVTAQDLVHTHDDPAIGCTVFSSATQSVPNTTVTAITLETEALDTNGFHSGTLNPSRITIPAGLGGRYLVLASVSYALNGTGLRQARIHVNGSAATVISVGALATGPARPISVIPLTLFSGDFLEVAAYQDSGAALDAEGGACYLSAVRLGA